MTKTNKWLVTLAVIPSTTLFSIDMSVVNVALPYIKGSMSASIEEITWVITGYMLSGVVLMPLVSFFSSLLGRKNYYMLSVLLFTISSLLCGISWNLPSIVIFRLLQGMGGGALIPLAQAILAETFPREEQGTAMAIFSLAIVLGPAIGPYIGGWIVTNYSWPWVFYVNLPIGLINLVLLYMFVEDPPFIQRFKGNVDWFGIAFLTIGLGTMQVVLTDGEYKDWFSSSYIVTLTIISAVATILFIIKELYSEKPAVNLKVLKDINLSANSLLSMVFSLGIFGSLFLLPMFLQNIMGYSAYDAGLAIMSRGFAMAFAMPLAGKLFNKLGPKILVGAGFILSIISSIQLGSLSLDMGFWEIFWPQFIQGIGFGFIIVSLNVSSLLTIENKYKTDASGLYNLIRQVAGSIGIAILATMMDNNVQIDHEVLGRNVSVYNTPGLMFMRHAAMITHSPVVYPPTQKALTLMNGFVTKQAFMIASNHAFLFMALAFLITLPIVFILKGVKAAKDSADKSVSSGVEL
ncbi:MAG: DHA2 family efflux MFS transporter permease subunit [bacterium]